MVSSVDIANQALVLLGGDVIIDFQNVQDDDAAEAQAVDVLYDSCKRSVLRSYPWNCAIRRAELALLAEKPVNEWPHAFAIPDKCLRVLQVYTGDWKAQRMRVWEDSAWQVEGKQILTWTDGSDGWGKIHAKYVHDITEEEMDVHVEMALVYALAEQLSYTLTGANTTHVNFAELAAQKMEEARTTDGLENPHKMFRTSRLRDVRY